MARSNASKTGKRLSLWDSVVVAALATGVLGAGGSWVSTQIENKERTEACQAAAVYLGDEKPNPHLTTTQQRQLTESSLQTLLECQRRSRDD